MRARAKGNGWDRRLAKLAMARLTMRGLARLATLPWPATHKEVMLRSTTRAPGNTTFYSCYNTSLVLIFNHHHTFQRSRSSVETDRQMGRQAGRQAGRQTDKQIDKPTDRYTHTDTQTHTHTHTHAHAHAHTHTH